MLVEIIHRITRMPHLRISGNKRKVEECINSNNDQNNNDKDIGLNNS